MRLNFSVQSLSCPEAGELSTVITVGVQVIWLQTDGTFYSVFYISARYLAIQCVGWVSTGSQATWIRWLHLLLNGSAKSYRSWVCSFKMTAEEQLLWSLQSWWKETCLNYPSRWKILCSLLNSKSFSTQILVLFLVFKNFILVFCFLVLFLESSFCICIIK